MEVFQSLLGKSKPRTPVAADNQTNGGFVNYVEKDLCDDLNEYVVIERPVKNGDYASHIYPQMLLNTFPPQSQSNWNSNPHQFTSGINFTSSKMGVAPSKCSNRVENGTEVTTSIPKILPSQPVHLPPPQTQLPTPQTSGPTSSDELYGASSFLSGIPFQLSNNLLAIQSLRSIPTQSYNFLSNKAKLLENLYYDFQLEHSVLRESEIAITPISC